jgi:hypothetical protein
MVVLEHQAYYYHEEDGTSRIEDEEERKQRIVKFTSMEASIEQFRALPILSLPSSTVRETLIPMFPMTTLDRM